MEKNNIITLLIAVVLSVAISAGLNSSGKDVEVIKTDGDEIKSYLMANPSVIREVLVEADRLERLEAERRIAETYKANIDELNNSELTPFVGPNDAKVTIVEFFDFNCGYCKRLAPVMMKVIKDNPDVKFVFKPVAFLAPSSQIAAKAVLAAQEHGKFIELYESLLTNNGALSESVIDEKIKNLGLDLDAMKTTMESDEIKKVFDEISALSQKIEIRGVPTLVINGEPLQAIEQDQIQKAIDARK